MGITASIVSAVLKTVVGDKLGSGLAKDLIGISIDRISEKGINEITDFINKGKSKIGSILSEENMQSMGISEDKIVYVVAEIKDLFSKISITDEVLRQCKYDSMNLSAFLWDKYKEYKNDYECESAFKRCLFTVAEALINLVRESEKFEKDVLIHISNSVDDANAGLENISDYLKENFGKLDDNSQIVLNILLMILEQIQKMNMQGNETESIADEKKFKNNKKQDYIDNWKSRLFLHKNNDKNPITLADAFIMPDYIFYGRIDMIDFCNDDKSFDHVIDKFLKYMTTSTMLITGVPGIGKSTITSWIANEYIDNDRVIILRFRDWERDELAEGLLNAIYSTLICKKKDLEDKILVLDGFDEIKILDTRERVLNRFLNDIKDFNNFKCIITSRPAYIDSTNFQFTFELQRFDLIKVERFSKIITGKDIDYANIYISNLDVIGIPVILYMALMSNIDICLNSSKSELYNRIFSNKGGIFDRFCDGRVEYGKGTQILRNVDNTEKYLKFLRDIGKCMFENDSLLLGKGEYEVPELEFQGMNISVLEFPIKHIFETSRNSIEFIHKSIYEYFVSEYIFVTIYEKINCNKKVLAGILGKILHKNILSNEILEFLKYKFELNMKNKFGLFMEIFQLMMQDGMTYYTGMCLKNVIKCEMNIFVNMLEIIHIWENENLEFDNIIVSYLMHNRNKNLNLKNIIFGSGIYNQKSQLLDLVDSPYLNREESIEINLEGVYLKEADLREVNLSNANLKGAILQSAKLTFANLSNTILIDANLMQADLRGVDLTGSNLLDAELEASRWDIDDFPQIIPQLRSSKFTYIIVNKMGRDVKKVFKKDLFSNEKCEMI